MVRPTSKGDQVILITHNGQGIRFKESDARPMGRASMGVRGIRLKGEDEVVSMDIIRDEDDSKLLVIMENGLSKTTPVSAYRFQARGGSGVKTAKLTAKTGKVVGGRIIHSDMKGDLVLISRKGQMIRLPLDQVPTTGRATQGVYVMRLKHKGDMVASLSLIITDTVEDDKQVLPLDSKQK